MTRNVNLQILCLPACDPVPVGYHKYERPGRPNTRASNKKFEYYIKIKDVEMSESTAMQEDRGTNIEVLADFLGSHMNLTSTKNVVVEPVVVDIDIDDTDISALFSKLSTADINL